MHGGRMQQTKGQGVMRLFRLAKACESSVWDSMMAELSWCSVYSVDRRTDGPRLAVLWPKCDEVAG